MVLGSFYVGPFSIRVYMTVIMMFFLLLKGLSSGGRISNSYPLPQKILVVYLLFIVFAAIALWANGEYSEFDFNKWILANYLNCFVTYFAIDYFISGRKELRAMWIFLILFGSVNAIITILQFMGNPIGKGIAMAFTTVSAVQADMLDEHGVNANLLLGEGLPIGLFGYVFTNGMMLSVLGVLLMGKNDLNKKLINIALVGLLLINVYASYATQERAAFFLLVFLIIYLIFSGSFSRKIKVTSACLILIAVVYILPQLLLSDSLGRLTSVSFEEDSRGDIWSYAFEFLKENLMFGGPIAYSKKTEIAPHNFFLFVFIYYGLIAGIIISYMYLLMTWQSIRTLLGKKNILTRAFAAACCIYSAICLFHNASIATGDATIFILYALMQKSIIMDKSSEKLKLSDNESTVLYR